MTLADRIGMTKIDQYALFTDYDNYKDLFAGLKNCLGKDPSLYDYHNLYSYCFNKIAGDFSGFLNFLIGTKYDEIQMLKIQKSKEYYYDKYCRSIKELDTVFNKYAVEFEKPDNINMEEFMKNQNELNIRLKNFFDSFVEEKSNAFYDSIPEKLKFKIGGVINEFNDFYDDLPLLVKHKFMSTTEDRIVCDNKSFIHDYFKSITPKGKKTKWESVHNLFDVTNLNSAKSIDKDSRLFEQWKAIKCLRVNNFPENLIIFL